MRERHLPKRSCRLGMLALGLSSVMGFIGCQSEYSGQTLPSPWYQKDDVQYFPAGPEFMLSNEAAAQKAYSASQPQQPGPGPAQAPAPQQP